MGLKRCRLAISCPQSSENRKAARKPRIEAPAKTMSPHRTTDTGIPTTLAGRREDSTSFRGSRARYLGGQTLRPVK
jgi:hypothetical protein